MTAVNDTLICDTLRLAVWRSDPDFDYNREVVEADYTLWEALMDWLGKWWRDTLGYTIGQEVLSWGLVAAGVALVVFIGWLMWKRKSGLFKRVGKAAAPSEDEDTIYGVDFTEAIARAVQQADYYRAVRLTYLHTLRELSDAGAIHWQLSKAPTEYVCELHDEEMALRLDRLTRLFVRVRYGNYKATADSFAQAKTLYEELHEALRKGGGSE